MAFELGLAYAIAQQRTHDFFVFEERPYRLQASLSDFGGHDPHIHGGTQAGVLRCVLDCFGTQSQKPTFATLKSLTRKLSQSISELEQEQNLRDPFHPYLFRQAVNAAVQIARAEGVIA